MAKYLMSEKTAAYVRGLMDRQSPNSARGQTRYGRPASAVEDSFALPYTLQWAQSVAEGEGAWIIWLPNECLLTVDGKPVDLTSELEPAGAPYPEGWYVLGCLDGESERLYLNVHIPEKTDDEESGDDEEPGETEPSDDEESGDEESSGGVTANFAAEEDEAEDGETVWPVLVAEMTGASVRRGVASAIAIAAPGGDGKFDGVTSLNDETGDMDIIGGRGVVVTTNGKTIKISADAEKDEEDDDPNNPDDPCQKHPESDGGVTDKDGEALAGGGGVDVGKEETDEMAGGGGCCGGSGTAGSATGEPVAGVNGQAAEPGSAGVNGKPAPSGGVSTGGASTGGASSAGSLGQAAPSSSGLANHSTTPTSGKLGSNATTALYSGTHNALTNSKTMNESPFKASGNFKAIGSNATTALYSGTHNTLTNSKTMNTSPWAKK